MLFQDNDSLAELAAKECAVEGDPIAILKERLSKQVQEEIAAKYNGNFKLNYNKITPMFLEQAFKNYQSTESPDVSPLRNQ